MTPSAKKSPPARKQKTCANPACGTKFAPSRLGQKVCGYQCGLAIAPANQQKVRKALDQIERKETKERKEKLKTRSNFVQEAEKSVRDYRRSFELLIGSGCISCGKSQSEINATQGWKTGGSFDAGHFLGKGARPELRMLPENIWLQCKACNAGSSKYARKGETVSQGFRIGLIERIGLAAVEALEADHEPRKYTIEELKALTVHYRAKTRELKKGEVA